MRALFKLHCTNDIKNYSYLQHKQKTYEVESLNPFEISKYFGIH